MLDFMVVRQVIGTSGTLRNCTSSQDKFQSSATQRTRAHASGHVAFNVGVGPSHSATSLGRVFVKDWL